MSKTICGFMAAGLLAVSLPILAATTIGARAAPASGASHDSAIDTPASEPTDFSSRRGGGGFGGGRGGGGRGGGFGGGRGGYGGGGRGYGGGGRGYGGGGRSVSHSSRTGGRTGSMRTGSTRTGSTRTGSTRTGSTRTGSTRTGTTHTGTTRTGTTRTGTTRTGTTHTGTTRTGTTHTGGTRTGTTHTGGTRTGTTHTGGTRTGTTRDGGTRTGTTRTGTTRDGGTRTGTTRDGGTRTGTTRTGTTRTGGTRVGGTRVGGTTSIRNRRISTFTGRRFWWRGSWRILISITLLTGFAIGPDFYYPEGYVALAEPVCTGTTDDGCALRWQDVAADDGSTIPQCVQFCPRVRTAAAPAPAPAPEAAAPRSGCEVEVFKDPNLAGGSFRTSEDQPLLNEEWDKKIASVNVISGTWDFTTEQQYNGDAMRLTPGTYRDLGPNWVDQISSFMCAQ